MKESLLLNAATATSNVTSIPYQLNDSKDYSIHVNFSSTGLNGSLVLEASNTNATNDYIPITESTQAVASGAKHMWNVYEAQYKFVRMAWTRTSGTGTITAYFVEKEKV